MQLRPSGTATGEQAQSKADLFKYCQPGATQAAFHPRDGGLTAMDKASLCATLSAFRGLGAGRFTTMKSAHATPFARWSAALLLGGLGFGLALYAADMTTGG